MVKIQSVRGTKDFIGDEAKKIFYLQRQARAIATRYNYQEIITPVIESVGVFTEALGQASDIIHKEMFVFEDRGGDKICLRPENTAGVMRAFVENGLQQQLPSKFFYYGPMFRYERPQKGRYRQFHQFGVEYLHAADEETARIDAEVISLAYQFLLSLNIGEMRLEINSLGNTASRNNYRKALVDYFTPYKNDLSADSQMRLTENPLRILDSKDEGDKKLLLSAPAMVDYYDTESKEKFAALQAILTDLKIPFVHNPKLVRGLDYYCHTAFEFITENLGAQGTILAGGRYDDLPAMFGAKGVVGVGFAAGLERLMALLPADRARDLPLFFLCPVGATAQQGILGLAEKLRAAGLRIDMGLSDNLKKSLSRANKLGAQVAIIVGEEELANKRYQWKDLQTGEQTLLSYDAMVDRALAIKNI